MQPKNLYEISLKLKFPKIPNITVLSPDPLAAVMFACGAFSCFGMIIKKNGRDIKPYQPWRGESVCRNIQAKPYEFNTMLKMNLAECKKILFN